MKLDDEAKEKRVNCFFSWKSCTRCCLCSKKLGVKATICMPAHTPLIKVDATKAHGADVVYMVKLMMKLMKSCRITKK